MAKTLFDKIWEQHVVVPETTNTPAILYIDLHLIHEVTSPQGFTLLRENNLKMRAPQRILATIDHAIPTVPINSIKDLDIVSAKGPADQIREMIKNCEDFGIDLFGLGSEQRGIVHVIGPELGATQPGKTIVCGDSHTSTHGALGALAFGIGSTEVGHVFATQCLLQRKPKTMAVNLNGKLNIGVSAKDIILKVINSIGVDGGTGHVIEYRGSAVPSLSLEERMTICNMTIEGGARAGLFAPDDATFDYLFNKPMSPKGNDWDQAVSRWKDLKTDNNASFDKEIDIDVGSLTPMITFGTNPGMAIPVDGTIPDHKGNKSVKQALDYMDFKSGQSLINHPINTVFIGSCTNSRISDLRDVATILKGRKVSENVRVLIAPGSQQVKSEAEAEGLDKIFQEAGVDWRESGCSMCIGVNGDHLEKGELAVSTSNRNFEGRQGPGSRTILASPKTAAASAIAGSVQDPRQLGDVDG